MSILIPPHAKAFIFDMDGTLVNSKPAHVKAWHRIMQEEQKEFTLKQFDILQGRTSAGFIDSLNKMYNLDLHPTETIHRKDMYYLQLLHEVSVYEKTFAIVREYYNKVPIALGTNENRITTLKVVQTLEIQKFFTTIVTADDVEYGKPAPDLFLKCASEMNVEPKVCHVFEDSPVGIQAAKNAGMSVEDVSLLV